MEQMPSNPFSSEVLAQPAQEPVAPPKKLGRPKGTTCSLARRMSEDGCRKLRVPCDETTLRWVKVKYKKVSDNRTPGTRYRCQCSTENPEIRNRKGRPIKNLDFKSDKVCEKLVGPKPGSNKRTSEEK